MEINGTNLTPQHVGGAAAFLLKKGLVSNPKTSVATTSAQPQARITPEAARELLKQHQGRLGGIMTAALQSMAGPVKRAVPQK